MALQTRLSSYCRDWLQPALDQLFQQLAPTSHWLCIEKLHLDLGKLSLETWEQHLLPLLLSQLQQALLVHSAATEAVVHLDQHTEQPATMRLDAEQHLFLAWLHFLDYGSLPWSFKLTNGQSLQAMLQQRWHNGPALTATQRRQLHQQLSKATSLQRLLLQFDHSTLLALLSQLAPRLLLACADWLAAYQPPSSVSSSAPATATATSPALTSSAVLANCCRQFQARADCASIIEQLFQLWLQHHPDASPDWQALLQHAPSTDSLTAGLQAQGLANHPHRQEQPTATATPTSPTTISLTHSVEAETANADAKLLSNTIDVGNGTTRPANDKAHATSNGHSEDTSLLLDGIYLDNAGLVLLHPFLPQLFRALQIAEDERIVQPERGLQLLHFLATGQTTVPEYELVLAKLLLNLPLTQSFATQNPLDGSAQLEAMAMLKAVIRHWQALRDTSPDGLRGSYLLRAGKLSQRYDGDWLLQVEHQGYDILLNQLPWGISMIKLPWMPKLLWVDWSY